MKHILSAVLLSAILLAGTPGYSNDVKPATAATRKISLESNFQKIKVGRHIHLVLIQDSNKSGAVITGDEEFIQAVNVTNKRGVLSISSKKNLKNKNISIYIPVFNLTSLELDTDASAATEGIVKLDNLQVIVHNGATVALQVIGNLQLEPAEECDIVYQTFQKSLVVYYK